MSIVDEIKEEIKSRTTNPFIGSFFIAFLIFNWYTPLTLLFYKQSELHLDGNYKTYKDVIYSQIDLLRNLVYPFLTAVLYVLAMPYLRGKIEEYQEGVAVTFQNNITKHKRRLLNIAEENQKLAASNTALSSEIDRKNSELENAKVIRNQLNQKIADLDARIIKDNYINHIIFGTWTVSIEDYSNKETWVISNFVIKKKIGNDHREIFGVETYVGIANKIMFKLKDPTGKHTMLELERHSADQNTFDGYINYTTDIRLIKVKPPTEMENPINI